MTLPPSRRALMLEWLDNPGAGPPPVEIRQGTTVTIDWPGGHIRLDDTPLDWSGPAKLHLRLEPVAGDLRTVTLFGWGPRMEALLP